METDPHKNGCTFDDLSNLCASAIFLCIWSNISSELPSYSKGSHLGTRTRPPVEEDDLPASRIRTACDFSNYICCPCKTIAFKIHNQNLHEYHLSFPESRGMSLPRMAGSFNTYLVVVAICNGQAYYKLVELNVHVYPVHVWILG